MQGDYVRGRIVVLGLIVGVVLTVYFPPLCFSANLQNSVVKIFVTSNPMDFSQPWQTHGTQSSSGSGCVLEGGAF